METTCLCDLTLCGQSHVTRADVSLFVTGLFMARQMTMHETCSTLLPKFRERLRAGIIYVAIRTNSAIFTSTRERRDPSKYNLKCLWKEVLNARPVYLRIAYDYQHEKSRDVSVRQDGPGFECWQG